MSNWKKFSDACKLLKWKPVVVVVVTDEKHYLHDRAKALDYLVKEVHFKQETAPFVVTGDTIALAVKHNGAKLRDLFAVFISPHAKMYQEGIFDALKLNPRPSVPASFPSAPPSPPLFPAIPIPPLFAAAASTTTTTPTATTTTTPTATTSPTSSNDVFFIRFF